MIMEGRVRHKETGRVGLVINSGGKLALVRWDDATRNKLVPTDELEPENPS